MLSYFQKDAEMVFLILLKMRPRIKGAGLEPALGYLKMYKVVSQHE